VTGGPKENDGIAESAVGAVGMRSADGSVTASGCIQRRG